ncbi:hypothetical protein [Paludibacter sp.]|uniref:hypothetical protein n=1 Tax=Paludibacter sp. TaxID=1898105 RepID=UPI0013541E1E|nr:hypothetical protein [Paludibacter sp.]MTK53816.1 hypothetical protein [Paludibacter sp.]
MKRFYSLSTNVVRMRTIFVLALIVSMAFGAKAAVLPLDTTIHFNSKTVKIEDNAEQVKIKVYDQGNDSVPYKQLYEGIFSDGKSYEKWTVMEEVGLQLPFLNKKHGEKYYRKSYSMQPHYAGFGIAYANITNDSHSKLTNVNGLAIKPDQSTEWFINLFEHILPIYRNTFGITTGLGMNWKTFRLDNNTHLVDVDGVTGVYNAPAGIKYQYSRLKIVHLTLPLMLEWQPTFGHDHKSYVAAGLEGGIKTFCSYKVKYNDAEGNTINRVEDKGLNTNPVSIDLIAQAGYGDFSVFAKYGLVKIFQSGKGPDVRAVSLGLMLHF